VPAVPRFYIFGNRRRNNMNRSLSLAVILLIAAGISNGQTAKVSGPGPAAAKASVGNNAVQLATLAFEAHGGEKLKAVKTLVVRGSVDMTTTAFTQTFPGTFSMAIAGERYMLELQSVKPFKQSFDGTNTYSTVRGITLPPLTSLGLPLLQKYGQPGYVVDALPSGAKKKHGFRMTAPDSTYTDFFTDEKTNQITGYESSFEVNGNLITTSAVVDKYRVVDGVYL